MTRTYDVCYCDGDDCLTPTAWFKVGSIQVLPVKATVPTIVNIAAVVTVYGTLGAWTASGDSYVREMKLLSDSAGTVGTDECYERPQSSQLVQGHTCSSTLDCDSPSSNIFGHRCYFVRSHPQLEPLEPFKI